MSDDNDSSPSGAESEPPQPGPTGLMSVDVIEEEADWSAVEDPAAAVREAAFAAARFSETGLAGTNAAIALASDGAVAALNASYRGKAAPTNVLSFPVAPPPHGVARAEPFLGDVILAAETVAREAAEMGIPARHHLQHLVVHGLLHLTGFDHDTDLAAERMEALETRILATLAIPDPYADAPVPAEAESCD
jgi:probable rRNA maturation factor